MKGNYLCKLWGITAFGESHGPAIGVVIEDIKPGIDFPHKEIQKELDRRKPGKGRISSSRKETDQLVVLSGVFEGKTTGMPICMLVYNRDSRSEDYEAVKDIFRPGHADLALYKKFKIYDYRGGGRVSGRETIARVAAGALVDQMIKPAKILVYPFSIGKIAAVSFDRDFIRNNELSWPCPATYKQLLSSLEEIREKGDSVGSIVQVLIENVPGGLGDPVFEKLDANLSKAILSIGGVKGIEFGAGFDLGKMLGSEANDPLLSLTPSTEPGKAGGIYGGMTTGDPVSFRFVVKPTPSISLPQQTITRHGKQETLNLNGRFDLCLIPRIIPVAEAMIKLVLADAISYRNLLKNALPELGELREALDKIDEDILLSLYRRNKIVEQVAALKKQKGIAVKQPDREAEIFRQLEDKGNKLELDSKMLKRIWQIILEFSRDKQ
jgi:chorismate synthase